MENILVELPLAAKLGVLPSPLNRVLNWTSGISAEMAFRLSNTLDSTHERRLTIRDDYDLGLVRQPVNPYGVERVEFGVV